ncbi:Transglycosylase SLT domain-containing protein [Saccharopolyspora shandongensis]|uniref:Transglycosylase SLT domain-containing protein n=1 Tax=Saccharopolyspora shandongensis TaxID=418495 RepID=A0A1H2TNF1_9PSEU|nr:transglycosylase SLT domain-containing protein [Saccharopolyspora shandongensis]SDW45308.1 Transglycosylase SLT domain-containing protein [Saccharopolyspora shandongensis]
MTPDEPNTPDRSLRQAGWHRWERAVPQTASWLRAAFLSDSADRQHRVPPKMRSLQVGAAVAAFGVIGVFAGTAGAKTEAPAVEAAAHVAPLAGQLPAPAVTPPAPEAAPAPAAQPAPEAAPEPAKQEQPAEQVAEKPKDQIGAWIDEAIGVLDKNGIPRAQVDADAIRTIIMHESNGDPNATNGWDSNAAAGTPSIGLMQTIEPTFQSFALPGHGDIYNPVDNIIAATRYAMTTYGSVADVPGVAGLRSGGNYSGY